MNIQNKSNDFLPILVVENDEIMCLLYSELFVNKEIDIVICQSIRDAKRAIDHHDFSLIILDNHLDDGFGLDLIPLIKSRMPFAPVVVVTASSDQRVMEEYFNLGASDCVIKPFHAGLMWTKTYKLLVQSQLEIEADRQRKVLQQHVYQEQQEEKLAYYVYQHMLGDVNSPAYMNAVTLPQTNFSGDIQLYRESPAGNQYIFFADATGHGLAAAISVLPMISIFNAMVFKGHRASAILHELNEKIRNFIPPDRFVAGIFIEIDIHQQCVNIWNGGMPPVYILDKENVIVEQVPSKSMALSILDPEHFNSSLFSIPIKKDQKVLFFSDGLIEQENDAKEVFGVSGFQAVLQDAKENIANFYADVITDFRQNTPVTDDISVCCLDLSKLPEDINRLKKKVPSNGNLMFELKLEGDQLKQIDALNGVYQFFSLMMLDKDRVQKAFTVISELYNNALDHGVLNLTSDLKNAGDFLAYIEEREQRLKALKHSDSVLLTFQWSGSKDELTITVKDSGLGFDTKSNVKSDTLNKSNELLEVQSHGWGVSLIKKLCTSYECLAPGNFTKVTL